MIKVVLHLRWLMTNDIFFSCRVSRSNGNRNFICNCGDSESESCMYDDSLPGMLIFFYTGILIVTFLSYP